MVKKDDPNELVDAGAKCAKAIGELLHAPVTRRSLGLGALSAFALSLFDSRGGSSLMFPEQAYALPSALVNGDFSYPGEFSMLPHHTWAICGWRSYDLYIAPNGDYLYTNGDYYGWSGPENWNAERFGWKSTQGGQYYLGHILSGVVQVMRQGDKRFGELCIHTPDSAIYQDIATVPGAVYKWSLKHASIDRSHRDTMSVMIGAPGAVSAQPAWRTSVNGLGDATGYVGYVFGSLTAISDRLHGTQTLSTNLYWETYQGEYLVPAGQTVTRFTFASVDPYEPTGGNFLADISFAIAYELIFNANGGWGNSLPDSLHLLHNEYVYLGGYTCGKTGYQFCGWSAYSQGSALKSASELESFKNNYGLTTGDFWMPDYNRTLYAVWLANTYKVRFLGNGATSGSMADQQMTYDVASALSDNAFVRAYSIHFDSHGGAPRLDALSCSWKFVRWATVADGSGSTFANKATVSNLTSTHGGVVSINAIWEPVAASLPDPGVREGYEFLGWYTAQTGGTRLGGIGDAVYADSSAHGSYIANGATLHAQWKPLYAEVTYIMDAKTADESVCGEVEKAPLGQVWKPGISASTWAATRSAALGASGRADIWYLDADGTVPFAPRTFVGSDAGIEKVTLYGFSLCDIALANSSADLPESPAARAYSTDGNSGAASSLDDLCGLPKTLKDVRYGTMVAFASVAGKETASFISIGAKSTSERALGVDACWCYSDASFDGGGYWHPYQCNAESRKWHISPDCDDSGSASVHVSGNATLYKRWRAGGYEGVRGR